MLNSSPTVVGDSSRSVIGLFFNAVLRSAKSSNAIVANTFLSSVFVLAFKNIVPSNASNVLILPKSMKQIISQIQA